MIDKYVDEIKTYCMESDRDERQEKILKLIVQIVYAEGMKEGLKYKGGKNGKTD
jgi:hypothetical protein